MMISGEMVGRPGIAPGARRRLAESEKGAGMLSICLDTARLNAWVPPQICRYPGSFDFRRVCLLSCASGSLSAGIRCIGE